MNALRFRQVAPLVLLGFMVLVVFETWIPGSDKLRAQFGETAVLRFVLLGTCVMLVVLMGEQLRMEMMFKQVLEQFKSFHGKAGEAGASNPTSGQQADAIRILIAALASEDAKVRNHARDNLKRIAGQDLGKDPSAWLRWLDDGVRQTGSED